MRFFAIAIYLLLAVMATAASVVSLREGESRAFRLFALLSTVAVAWAGALWQVAASAPWLAACSTVLVALPITASLLPYDPVRRSLRTSAPPSKNVDERDVIFARRRLVPGTTRFEAYYSEHPQKRAVDDRWRARPGLLSTDAAFYQPLWFAAADASFDTIEALHPYVDGPVEDNRVPLDAVEATRFVKDWLQHSGAHSVGVTALRDYHLYTHRGRQEPYGEPIRKRHRWAIAFTVEMSHELLRFAPLAPTVRESADQYLRAGAMAVKLAWMIRKLGYPARAHVDGNYEVICPLVARDAGLGEIGRMGLLMTPRLGPRVRIAVVTTDLPLVPDAAQPDAAVIDACLHCRKCAANCPAQAIPFGPRVDEQGVLRWRIDAGACFTYWSTVGTDCARCVRVCPFSHPDNWLHQLVRTGIHRSALFRRVALKLDDVFYGTKPPVKPLPS